MITPSYEPIEYVGGMECSGCHNNVMLDTTWICPCCIKDLLDEF
jgi:predicted amidophosphoribosyltransferase